MSSEEPLRIEVLEKDEVDATSKSDESTRCCFLKQTPGAGPPPPPRLTPLLSATGPPPPPRLTPLLSAAGPPPPPRLTPLLSATGHHD